MSRLLAGGATWGGKDRRSQPRPTPPPQEVSPSLAAPAPAPASDDEQAPAPPPAAEPEAKAESPSAEEAQVKRGPLKQKGSGTGFLAEPEPEKVEKPKRRLFDRPERLKVEKSKGKETPSPVVDSRVVRGRTAKFSRLRVPLKSHHLAVISGAGGTGKTTTAVMLGWLLAEARDSGVVLLEAMPGGGGVAHRLGIDLEMSSADVFRVASYAHGLEDVRSVTHKFGKLEVVGTDNEPRLQDLLDPGEHEQVLDLLRQSYPIVVSDTETGLLSPRTTTTLEYADQIVFCATTDEGAAWRTAATLNWLLHLGGEAADLAKRTVVVAHEVRPGTLEGFGLARDQILSRCRAIITIPFDAQFAVGGALDLAQVADVTYDAYLDLAVELSHEFGVVSR